MKNLCVLVILALGLLVTHAFEEGSPAWACVDGYPRHDHYQAQTSTPPNTISLSASSYNPDDSITVTLSGAEYEGFVIRAFRIATADDPEEIVGKFTTIPSTARGLTWLGETNNCVTQADEEDFGTLTFTWKAPSSSVGDVYFKATVLQDFEEFWVNVVSSTLTASVAEVIDPNFNSVVNTDFSDFRFYDGCGSTKGCLMYPGGCLGSDCTAVVSYEGLSSDSQVKFEVMLKQNNGYVSVGFSQDRDMGDELTVNCLRAGDALSVQHGLNLIDDEEGMDWNGRQRITDLSDIHIISQNGNLYCSFTRDTTLTYTVAGKSSTATSDLTQSVYLFVAFGENFRDSDVMKEHDTNPITSTTKVNVLSKTISRGTSTPILISVHVTFAVLGYFLVSGFSMLIARHYRKELGRPCKPCTGRGMYFHIHRAIMIPMLCFGAIAVILAIVSIGGWSLDPITTAHGIFALIATALMLVNIILGFRPPKRKVFLLVHRIFAVLSYICIVVSFLLGSNSEVLIPQLKFRETIILGVGFGFQILIEIILEILLCRKDSPAKYKTSEVAMERSDMEMKGHDNEAADQSSERGASPKPASKSKKSNKYNIKMAFLGLYLIGTFAVAIASIVLAYLY